jgi:HD-GYP domain-containing protein (c-di-GMP phosphodiesterase class II)
VPRPQAAASAAQLGRGALDIEPARSQRRSRPGERSRDRRGHRRHLGLNAPTRRLLRRAALLHDVGKLGVSNRILDRRGSLSDEKWRAVRRHPRLSLVILRSVTALADVARLSATHHERLDGSGYPYGLSAAELDLPARILQVADLADALSAERPYRAALPVDEALAIMRRDAGPRLDEDAFTALEAWLPGRDGALAAAA